MNAITVFEQKKQAPEAWRYTEIAWLNDIVFGSPVGQTTPNLPTATTAHRCVVVDGAYRPDLSSLKDAPAGLVVSGVGTSLRVDIAADQCLALAPIEVLYVWTEAEKPIAEKSRLVITLGASARLTLIERHVAQTNTGFVAHEVDTNIKLAAQAKLVHGKIVEGTESYAHFGRASVTVDKGAFYDRFALTVGGKIIRCETNVDLEGALAETRLMAVKLLCGSTHADTALAVRHLAPHGVSRQLVKTVLDDKARGVFQGKIHVAPGAQKTDGQQLSRALLLSDMAEMDAKPELEIYADDVKCSHGSTIGDLDDAALFYLRSRGIPEVQARALLVEAFVGEVLDQIQSAELESLARSVVERKKD